MDEKMATFETLSGATFIIMEPQEILTLSRDELLCLVFRSKAIVTAINTTLSSETADPLSVAEVMNMQPKEITARSRRGTSPFALSTSTSKLPSEPLPWRPNTRPKLPPGALLDIDQGPLWDILTEWLWINDVCNLDSALCQKNRRPEFLQLLATKILRFNKKEIRVLTDPYEYDRSSHRPLGAAALKWVLEKGIHLASLLLPPYIDKAEQQSIRKAVASLAVNGHLDKLERISFNDCTYIEDADLAAILSKCYSSVKSIKIEGCDLSDSAATHIKRCTKLEAFTPSGYWSSAAEMAEIFKACRKLRKVHLSRFDEEFTDEMVLSVADNCPFLEHFSLSECCAVSDEAIRRLAESCPLLQFVDLMQTQITDATVVALCIRCPSLKRMFLCSCDNLTDESVLAVAERLPGLTHIDLELIKAITSSAVETLASKCRELKYISIGYCPNINDVTLTKIAEHCSKLEHLGVVGWPDVTDVGATEIATKCSKLKIIHSYGNLNLPLLRIMFPHTDWQSCR